MGQVISSATMSVDGFIAYDDNSVGALFDWYGNGEVEVPTAGELPTMRMSAPSAAYWREWTARLGCLVVGRTLFDHTDGWHGTHPLGVPVVVVTHRPPPSDWSHPDFRFVTGGIDAALDTAQGIAGEKVIGVAAGTIAAQALTAGRLDRIAIDLAPVVLGSGRPYFPGLTGGVELSDPVRCIAGDRVTHLLYDVRR